MTDPVEVKPTTSWKEVGTVLAGVTTGENEFVVLSKGESGDDYIQASMWNAGMILSPSCIAEISIVSEGGVRHYITKTKDFNIIFSAPRLLRRLGFGGYQVG